MQIMFLGSKLSRALAFVLLGFMLVGNVFSDVALSWVSNNDGLAHIGMADGSYYDLKLSPDVEGVFYDGGKHKIESERYVSLFQVLHSNPNNPTGLCGTGNEVWLYVYKVTGTTLGARERVLVSSCLRSISLASQNSGEAAQDTDFSSVQWNAQGFSIEWFDNVGAAGQPLSSTNYVLRDGVFLRQEVLSKENQKK